MVWCAIRIGIWKSHSQKVLFRGGTVVTPPNHIFLHYISYMLENVYENAFFFGVVVVVHVFGKQQKKPEKTSIYLLQKATSVLYGWPSGEGSEMLQKSVQGLNQAESQLDGKSWPPKHFLEEILWKKTESYRVTWYKAFSRLDDLLQIQRIPILRGMFLETWRLTKRFFFSMWSIK